MTARDPDRLCGGCLRVPVNRCARCAAGMCRAHLPARGGRCLACEHEWLEDRGTRRALQHMFAPPAFLLGGGLAFGLLFPLLMALPFTIGATVIAALATSAGFTAAAGTCRLIDRTARAQFLAEHARKLPEARVVKWPSHPRRRALPPGRA